MIKISRLEGVGGQKEQEQGIGKKRVLLVFVAFCIIFVVGSFGAVTLYYLYFYQPKTSSPDILPTGMAVAVVTSTSSTTSSSSTTSTVPLTTIAPTTTTLIITTSIAPTCDDGIWNQGEKDVDCGGPCDPCVKPVEKAALCISSKGVTLYMRDSIVCMQCKSIKNYFGGYLSLFNVVDCDDDDNEDRCEDMLEKAEEQDKRKGYPTWEIYGELYPGYSAQRIQSVTGCL